MESIVFFFGLPVPLELGLAGSADADATAPLSSLTDSVASGAVVSLAASFSFSVLDLSRSSRRFSFARYLSDFFFSFSSDEYSFFFVFELENKD